MNRKQNSLMRFSRTERLAQLSEQEIVIERKKREIQAKIEAQKKKETEEALRKLESSGQSKSHKPGFSKKSSWKRDDYQKDKEKEKSTEQEKKESLTNAFSNDGSFLDQFKKLSRTGLAPANVDVHTLALARKKEEDEKLKNQETCDRELYRPRREYDRMDDYSKDRERNLERDKEDQKSNDSSHLSMARKPLDSNIQLQLPPPGVVQLVPQHQVQIVSLVQPVVQNPVPMVPPPAAQIPALQPLVLNSVPSFTTNEIQLKAISSPDFTETRQSVPPVQVPSVQLATPGMMVPEENNQQVKSVPSLIQPPVVTQLSSIQPPLPMTPQNIPPPSPIQVQNIPPPPLPPKEIELFPKVRSESISMTLKKPNVKKLEPTPNPLDIDDIPTPPGRETKFSFSEMQEESKSSGRSSGFDSIPLPGNVYSPEEESTRISPALYNDENEGQNDEGSDDKNRHLAEMVARCGDDVEDLLRNRNEDDPALRFLFDKNSKEYLSYRKLVQKYRNKLQEAESSEKFEKRSRISNSSDEDEEDLRGGRISKNRCEDKSSSQEPSTTQSLNIGRQEGSNSPKEMYKDNKFNDGYQADNEEELPYYKIPEATSKAASFVPNQREETSEKSDSKTKEENSEQAKAEERRKRKRKSRWGDVVATPSSIPPPTVATNLAIQPPGKLPAPKTTLLSQLTRSDPGLIQYARQTFGSTNLSEEDWKKAEDHYKINLLYQDMVKKRAEIDKLERAGKFKYEYDSDEDVEGGTWEHKLRQQEMMATQLWAEELTRQAAGKHHIGDFLPPEELERFMEKYNAVKEGREPDLSDYKEFKLKEDNVGYRLLQKMGWNEGQGLGQDGSGITNPVNKATTRHENQGLGIDRPDGLEAGDDEYDAYRKRMMLAYRFRPNPLNNPRRPYY